MFETLKRAVTQTERPNLDAVYARVTSTWSNGQITDDECLELYAQIERARTSVFSPRRKRNRKPVSRTTLAHRRQLAASGPLPSHLAAGFTTSELAVLAIITINNGFFDRSVKELADRAGVGHSTVQRAIRTAEAAGLITIEERRVQGRKNLPNIIRVVSKDWLAWIVRGGSKKLKPIDTNYINSCNERVPRPYNRAWNGSIFRPSPGQSATRNRQLR